MAWLAGYSKRKPITITGGASGAQTDFQLKLNAVYAAAMQSDFDDLRFTQADGTTLIDAWLESKVDDDSAVVWAEFPTTPANTVEQTYYMYYGKVVASDWDGAATFIQYHGAATSDFIDSLIISHTAASVWEGKVKATAATHNTFWGLANSIVADSDWSRVQSYSAGNLRYHVEQKSAGTYTLKSEAPSLTNNTYYKGKITFDGTTKKGYFDDNEIGSGGIWTNLPNTSLGLAMKAQGGTCAQEWSFVRKYAANPPTYAFGAEESAPVGGAAPTSIFYGPFVGPLGGPL